jgi:hypothetical protein
VAERERERVERERKKDSIHICTEIERTPCGVSGGDLIQIASVAMI